MWGDSSKVPADKKTIVYAMNVDMLQSAAPWATSSGYDWYWEYEVFEYLVQPELDFSGYHPQLATSWDTSADGRTWTIHLRENVKFHDGVEMTADDVVYTFYLNTDPEAASVAYGYMLGVLGHKLTFTWLNGTSTTVDRGEPHDVGSIKALDKYTVEVTLPKVYGLFYPETMSYNGVPIVPKHVLEPIGMANIRTHPFATGQGKYTVKLPGGGTYETTGPIGTKAYRWDSWDPSKKMITLTKFNDYWDRQRLESNGMFAVETLAYVTIYEKEPAIAALKAGQVDILTHEYQVNKEYAAHIFDNEWSKAELFVPAEWQELGLNMYHPVFGTGVDTPLGKSDPSKAAEAAKHVRKAISYLVPRQLIVEKLLDGLGTEGIVPMAPWSMGFPKNIKPYEYSIEKAKEELRLAGYQVKGGPLTLSVPSTLQAGQPLAIEGTFMNITATPARPYEGLTISIYQSMDKNTWTLLGSATTGSDGKYTYTVTPTEAGTFYFKASFAGKTAEVQQYAGENPLGRVVIAPQESEIAAVAVVTFWDAYGTTIAAAVILILVLIVAAVLLKRRRKPA